MKKVFYFILAVILTAMFMAECITFGEIIRMIVLNGQNMSITVLWGLIFGCGGMAGILGFITWEQIVESFQVICGELEEPEKEPEEEHHVNWLTPDE